MALVAHTGFEPVISSLRGRCPKPLDECAIYQTATKCSQNSYLIDSYSHTLVVQAKEL